MKNLPFYIKILFVMMLSALMQYIISDPTWLGVIAFLAGWLLGNSVKQAIWLGGLGSSLPWFGLAFWFDFGNQHILSTRMSGLFHLPGYGFILLITFVLPFIVGSLSSVAGYFFQVWINKK